MFNNNVCEYCGKEINEYCLNDIDKKYSFCNLICAKLYNDCVEKIELDYNRYIELIDKHLIDKNNVKIFDKFNKIGLDFMPTIYNIKVDKDDVNEKNNILKEYLKNIY